MPKVLVEFDTEGIGIWGGTCPLAWLFHPAVDGLDLGLMKGTLPTLGFSWGT
jgi:hypothetical protein